VALEKDEAIFNAILLPMKRMIEEEETTEEEEEEEDDNTKDPDAMEVEVFSFARNRNTSK
jgi:CO dehydrogenase/acetyl-CoA synthase beta subunit